MALFGDDGKVIDRDALRSVQFNGAGMTIPRAKVTADGAKVVEVLDESTGRHAGHHTHHPDGRVDATAVIPPAHMQAHTPKDN